MGAERFNPDRPGAAWSIPPYEAGGQFNAANKPDPGPEKKSNKRKKRHRNRGEDAAAGTPQRKPESKGTPPLMGGDGMIWERDQPGGKDKPALLGGKAFAAAEKAGDSGESEKSKDKEASKTDTPAAEAEKPSAEAAAVDTAAASEKPVGESAEQPAAKTDAGEEKRPDDKREAPAEPADEAAEAQPSENRETEASGPDAQEPHGHGQPVERAPEPEYAAEAAPPPLPPDPVSYRRQFWNEQPGMTTAERAEEHEALPSIYEYEQINPQAEQVVARQEAVMETAGRTAAANTARYESDIPPGLQRTPAEVSRAAWTGLLAGWWLGRRGKRKAVEQARKVGLQVGRRDAERTQPAAAYRATPEQTSSPRLEAEPIHTYQAQEASRRTVQPLSVETHVPAVERAAAPVAAAIAVFERAIPRPTPAELPPAARRAAAKAAEAVIERKPEAAIGARLERSLGKHEVMQVAKDIKIEGVSLKEMYKAKRIDEEGLRAVVETYLIGGDVRKQLSRELVAKEQSYELDPSLRHVHRHEHDRRRSGETSEKIGKVLGQAREIAIEQGGKLAASTQKTAQKASKAVASGAKRAQRDIIDGSNTSDWISITAVVVVWSAILLILFG